MLELKHISKIYNPGLVTEMCLFDDFNFAVNDGEFVSVIGSNGSGKTSMLNIICGSIPVNAGEVLINGKCVNKKKDFERYAYIGRVPKSLNGQLPEYDDTRKYVACRQ